MDCFDRRPACNCPNLLVSLALVPANPGESSERVNIFGAYRRVIADNRKVIQNSRAKILVSSFCVYIGNSFEQGRFERAIDY
jgi:hypothetical protein